MKRDKVPGYARPMCEECGKRTVAKGSVRCAECEPGVAACLVCRCRKGSNWENCRACDLAIRIAILRVRFRKQWLQLKSALKEVFK